jgi:hypothetical protein
VKSQAITSLIINSGRFQQRQSKIKLTVYLSAAFFKRKQQAAFDKLLRWRMRNRIIEKAVASLATKYRRLQKDDLRQSLDNLRVYQSESKLHLHLPKGPVKKQPLVSPRMSECSERSHIFSVSEDSLGDSKIIFEDKRDYGNEDVRTLRVENEELKRMELSQEAIDGLVKMQRFNRFNYNLET